MTRLIGAFIGGLMALSALLPGQAMAQDGYKIHPGDVLRIEVLEDPSLNRDALVAPDGRFTFSLVGSVRASGQTVDAVQAQLSQKLAPNFAAAPTVFVALERLSDRASGNGGSKREAATISIYVMGEAAKPGKLMVSPGTTVLQAFAEMGGFGKFAATKRILLRRTDARSKAESTYKLNYDAIVAGSSPNGNVVLQPGDVIIVPQRHLFE